ncbi:hypothetical protein QWI17_23350 [Gilvimarinus sp. SDUM040013]|uniref:Uncharacterized protein n=1 Tax=Gilvimarinus gilvus TaxID=3058038 RepID=A0ABU4S2D7_9GAMM|nr:hypothetical protein [Gilvimarinus sp. SDUM040013]MDO3388803.1 hypothetical protein [Gilvimarinus sp. SDUM040013]MDX6850556.1 hypothetical protein [Gilvimarinus sp. SDUM040013]
MSTLFDVIVCGTDIFIENHTESVITGFLTCRRIDAQDAEQAAVHACHQILIHWNQSYNSDRKLGVPKLHVELIQNARRWINRAPTQEYYFYDSAERKREHFQQLCRSTRPWYRLNQSN